MLDHAYYSQTNYKKVEKQTTLKKLFQGLAAGIINEIEGIYNFIKKSLFQFFDIDAPIPKSIKEHLVKDAGSNIAEIQQLLSELNVDPKLTSIVSGPFEKLILKGESISYRQFEYLKEMQATVKTAANGDSILLDLLHLNFNSQRFFNYYIEKIKANIQIESETSDLIIYYTYQIKIINQNTFGTELYLDPALSSIRDQLVSWITEEIYFLDKKHSLASIGVEPDTKPPGSEYKVQTSFSVAHLSLALKLLLDSGIIKNKNIKELIRNVAKNFRNEKLETISEISLRNKFYDYEARTVGELKDIIINLLNLVRKY
ncbi:MAG: hypothetical protein ABI402_21095 [Ferruginibacter sp.]